MFRAAGKKNPQRPAHRVSNPRSMAWETSVFPICCYPMCCVLAFRTTRSDLPQLRLGTPPPSYRSYLQGSDRPRGSTRSSVSAAFATKRNVTWESHVFQVCSSPVATQSEFPPNPRCLLRYGLSLTSSLHSYCSLDKGVAYTGGGGESLSAATRAVSVIFFWCSGARRVRQPPRRAAVLGRAWTLGLELCTVSIW